MSFTLFPRPTHLKKSDEIITISYPITISLPEDLSSLQSIMDETLDCPTLFSPTPLLTFQKEDSLGKEAYRLVITTDGIQISYSERNGAFYALVTLSQMIHQCNTELPCCEIFDEPALSVRGYLLDISRGKVPTLEDLCSYVNLLSSLKYNQLQLYVEGFSFAYPSFTEVWKDATPITGEEIRYLDTYCKERGIELVPNQNSLGHMADWLARDEYKHLAELEPGASRYINTLDAMNPESLELVTALMDDMLPYFTSSIFNVNLDEPYDLGKGKNKELAAQKGHAYLYMDYLKRLHERVTARGKEMYMWGDILASHPETLADLPKDITVLDWGYEADAPFASRAADLKKYGLPFILCPGTSVWTTLTGRTENMIGNILSAATSAIEYDAKGVLVTAWGDDGHIEYRPLNETGITYAAACNWGRLDTTEKEVVDYLNHHVYQDASEKTAQIILDIGRLYHYEEYPMFNGTIASMILLMEELSAEKLTETLINTGKRIRNYTPSVASLIDDYLEGKRGFDFDGVMDEILKLKKRIQEVDLHCNGAALLTKELENTLRISEFAQIVHYLNTNPALSDGEQTSLLLTLKELGFTLLREHEHIWISRNRLHGMEESVAGIKRILNHI